MTLMLNNHTSTDQLDVAGPHYSIVIQNQSSNVLLVNNNYNNDQNKNISNRDDVNATQVQDDAKLSNGQIHRRASSNRIDQKNLPNTTKSQILNFDNITMREDITPK